MEFEYNTKLRTLRLIQTKINYYEPKTKKRYHANCKPTKGMVQISTSILSHNPKKKKKTFPYLSKKSKKHNLKKKNN